MDARALAVGTDDQEDVVTVRCVGELDLSTCQHVRDAIDRALRCDPVRSWIDLTEPISMTARVNG